jgi:hypothetical protein
MLPQHDFSFSVLLVQDSGREGGWVREGERNTHTHTETERETETETERESF